MCIFTVKLKIILDGFRIAQFLQQLIMDCLVENTVQIMLDGFRIAQFLQQLIMDCLVGNTVQKYNQLQAPVYNAVIKYAWYATKLIMPHENFSILNQIAFLDHKNCRMWVQQASVHLMVLVPQISVFVALMMGTILATASLSCWYI